MASANHLLNTLLRQLQQLDDGAFAALASAGLLRRARKDLESQTPELQARDHEVAVKLAAHTVTLDERGVTHARCTCPSKTVCQHILAACLHLKSLATQSESAETTSAEDRRGILLAELLSIELSALVRYAGKASVREAIDAVGSDVAAELSFEGSLVIRLTQPRLEFRYVGGGPENLITDFRGRTAKKMAVQAILAVQRAHGIEHALPGNEAQADSASDVLELRRTVLDKIERLLRECIDVGLTHLSEGFIERSSALATAAEGARLHRLSLALSRLGDYVDLFRERHASADSSALLTQLATTYALTSALADPRSANRADLIGEARSSYEELGTLELYCAGAHVWQTASGYWGLTVLFWSPAQGRWLTYSDSRPLGTLGFSPAEAYRGSPAWRGCPSLEALRGRWLTLTHASANRLGRLSGSSSTSIDVQSSRVELPTFAGYRYDNWNHLRAHAEASLDRVGLAEGNPNAEYVVLHPRRLLNSSFDDTTQTLVRFIEDGAGNHLQLRLEYSTATAKAVERLDALELEFGIDVLAQVNSAAGMLVCRPLTLLRGDGSVVDNLFLDDPPAISRAQAMMDKLRATLSGRPTSPPVEHTVRSMNVMERLLRELDALLLDAAERGTAFRHAPTDRLSETFRRLNDHGLALFDAGAQMSAERLLRTRYVSQLAQECLGRTPE